MKRICTLVTWISALMLSLSACGSQKDTNESLRKMETSSQSEMKNETESNDREQSEESGESQMIIELNGYEFKTELYDNETVRALVEMLPMTLTMDELNGNEKFYFMDKSLPTDTQSIGTIQNGDIMLYGTDCLVLFFKTFDTSYTYTRIGHIEDAEAFSAVLDKGTVEVNFYME